MDASMEEGDSAPASRKTQVTHFLLYLNQHTFQGECGEELTREVRAASYRSPRASLYRRMPPAARTPPPSSCRSC